MPEEGPGVVRVRRYAALGDFHAGRVLRVEDDSGLCFEVGRLVAEPRCAVGGCGPEVAHDHDGGRERCGVVPPAGRAEERVALVEDRDKWRRRGVLWEPLIYI